MILSGIPADPAADVRCTEMKNGVLDRLVLGMVSTNVWFLKNKETGELLVVDPADRADAIERKAQMMEGKPAAILLTHGHFDHILAADSLRRRWDVPIYAMEDERELLADPAKNLSGDWGSACSIEADHWLRDNEELELAGFRIRVLHTPGHTAGSCCYYLADEAILISGDTLFLGSVGRTDMPTASGRQMQQSIHRLLGELPDETKVYPGHDDETTIAYEKRYNPFA